MRMKFSFLKLNIFSVQILLTDVQFDCNDIEMISTLFPLQLGNMGWLPDVFAAQLREA